MYNYFQNVLNDVRDWIDEHYTEEELIEKLADADSFREELHDAMWCADSVTGNGSGSYAFSRYKAQEYVLENLDLLREACEDFCCLDELGTRFVDDDWEWMDVTIRCYRLAATIDWIVEGLVTYGLDEVRNEQ